MPVKVSVDLWGTLIKSSPYFVNAKSNLIRRFLNGHLTDFEIERIYRITKLQLNEVIEVTGWQPSQDAIFQLLLCNLSKRKEIAFPWIGEFMHKYQELALNFKPKLYDDNTFRALDLLSEKCELVLSSNTMFVEGATLKKILEEMGLAEYFTKMLFSSEVGFSKPHRSMYDGSDYHIGDNTLTDYIGAAHAGSKGILINNHDKQTLHDAYYIITQNG